MADLKGNPLKTGSSGDLSPLQRAAMTIRELKLKLGTAKQVQHEPVAVVGMACRFPGAPDLDSFWELLKRGGDAVSEVPPERWNLDQWFDPRPNAPGKINTRYGGFIEDVDCFDTGFFGIPPREAQQMDPGQRILLELVWNALEHAGIPPDSLRGSNTGFFVGMGQNDYGAMQINGDPEEISAYSGTGNGGCFASGRISYQFGFNGPTLTTDTACSSSITALYQALNALRQGECNLALTSGVQLNLTPPMQVFFSRTQSFSPDGRCYTFDERANGFVLGEGAGVVVLQRLKDAQREGSRILGVIRSVALNHGGASGGLTVPNETAQEALIRNALQREGIDPNTVDYIETHGTGTTLGDPIEVGALRSVFGHRSEENPLQIGSVKTNIGHLNAAAGMAGLIKTVLMLQNRQIAPNLHFTRPNSKIPWDGFAATVPTTLTPWPAPGSHPRRAGVSSFGLSGTNGHVVLEEAPGMKVEPVTPSGREERSSHLFTLSAQSEKALRTLAERHILHLEKRREEINLPDYCFSANTGRSHLEHRAVITCSSMDELLDGLQALKNEDKPASTSVLQRGYCRKGVLPKVLMLMAENPIPRLRTLLPIEPFVRQELIRLEKLSGISLTDEIEKENRSSVLEFAAYRVLCRLWQQWGVKPAAVQAAGIGEWAAAVTGNAMSDEEALKVMVQKNGKPRLNKADVTLLDAGGNRLESLNGLNKEINLPPAAAYQLILTIGGRVVRTDESDDESKKMDEASKPWSRLQHDLAKLYLSGVSIDWRAVDLGFHRELLTLPSYPFSRDHYWLDKNSTEDMPPIEQPSTDAGEPLKNSEATAFSPAKMNSGKNGARMPGGSDVLPGNNGLEISPGTSMPDMADGASISNIMEMQLRLTTDALKNVTDQQFEFLRQKMKAIGPDSNPGVVENDSDQETLSEMDPVSCGNWKLLLLEGRNEADIERKKETTARRLQVEPSSVLSASRDTLLHKKGEMKRLVLTYQNPEDASRILGEKETKKTIVADSPAQQPAVVLMFPGVGDHYLNLGLGLYQSEPVFRKVVDECCDVLEPVLKTDLRKVVYPEPDPATGTPEGDENVSKPKFDLKAMLGRGGTADPRQERMNQTRFSQPLVFIIEYALGRLWQARGVHPSAMIGYSIGEYCAAVLSGVMKLEDALLLVSRRAELIESVEAGAMLAVPLGEQAIAGLLGTELSVAISSTPSQSVVGGPVQAVEALEKELGEREIVCRRLQGSHAFHTGMLEPLHLPLVELISQFSLQPPKIPFISNLTGTWITDAEATDSEYWARHTWQKVRFAEGMGQLLGSDFPEHDGVRIFLEAGPGVSLGSFMLQHPESGRLKRKMNLPSLRTMYERTPDEQFLLNTVGKLFLAGHKFSTVST